MNAVILSFDSNEKQSVICERKQFNYETYGSSIESDSVKSARKAKDKLHKACERASETRERTLHGQEQNIAHAYGKHESHETVIDFTITCTAVPRVWHFSAFHLL